LGRTTAAEDPPTEFLSLEKLEGAHAFALELGAGRCRGAGAHRRSGRHLARLREHEERLRAAYLAAADDVHRGEAITPAGEWLLDNFHMVEAEVRNVRHDLPRGYHRRLPRAARGDDRARIELLAEDLLAHSEGRLEAARCTRYLAAFQTAAPLSIGELWAWPSVLKLALLTHLRHLTDAMLDARASRAEETAFVRLIDAAQEGDGLPELPDTPRVAFVVQLVQRLREYGSTVALFRFALDEHLARLGRSVEHDIREETQRQATAQVSVANVFTSLRFCATEDWREVFERASLVEHPAARSRGHPRSHGFPVARSLSEGRRVARGPRGEDRRGRRARRRAARHAADDEVPTRAAHVGEHLIGASRQRSSRLAAPTWSTACTPPRSRTRRPSTSACSRS
jgi:cyclic beta-1,2-glucan synthetase